MSDMFDKFVCWWVKGKGKVESVEDRCREERASGQVDRRVIYPFYGPLRARNQWPDVSVT
jgi:hypothetical protein